MGQQRNLIIGIVIGLIVILFGLLMIGSFVVNNQGQQVGYYETSTEISSTNSSVGTAISATSFAKQNAPVSYSTEDQLSGATATPAEGEPTRNAQTRIV